MLDKPSKKTLDALPTRAGFRLRGMDMTRLETFTDAAFAFAVTLLVVGGGDSIPSNFEEMVGAMKQVPAFAASFANIMLFWYAHHIWSRRFGLEDAASVALSLLLVFIVLIFVYPLKAIYSGAFDWFSRGYLDSYFGLSSLQDLSNMFVIFGTSYAALSGSIVLLNRYAYGIRDRLALNELEAYDTVTDIQFWLINTLVPVGSVVIAVTAPDRLVVAAGLFYWILGALLPWHAFRRDRKRQALTPHST